MSSDLHTLEQTDSNHMAGASQHPREVSWTAATHHTSPGGHWQPCRAEEQQSWGSLSAAEVTSLWQRGVEVQSCGHTRLQHGHSQKPPRSVNKLLG